MAEDLSITTPCKDNNLKKLCSTYSDTLPCCDTLMRGRSQFRYEQRRKILTGRADCVDLFELKEEILKSSCFEFKVTSWCMYPALKRGDTLKVEPVRARDIRVGDIPVYRSNDRLYAHRIVGKEITDKRERIITRPDSSKGIDDPKRGERVREEEILGIIKQIKRGRRIVSAEKRSPTPWEKFLYRKAIMYSKSLALFKNILGIVLTRIQSFRFYEVFAMGISARLRRDLSFELALPFSGERLNRLYTYIPLKNDEKTDFTKLKIAKNFHLVLKLNKRSIGVLTILNRPDRCPHKGFRIADLYIRLRYRRLGFDSILIRKTKDILKALGIRKAKKDLSF